MSVQFTANDTTRLVGSGTGINLPITVFLWVRATNWDSFLRLFCISDDYGTDTDNSILTVIASPDQARGQHYDSTNTVDAFSRSITTNAADDTWVPMAAVVASTSSRKIWTYNATDGELSNTDTNPTLSSSLNMGTVILGAGPDGATSGNFYAAECAIWNSALSVANLTSLRNGANPTTVDGANLFGYWSLRNDGSGSYADESGNGGPTLTLTGTSINEGVASHPPVDTLGSITSVDSDDVITRGQTSVSIVGTGFTGATGVLIGSIAQANFTVVNDTEITFDVDYLDVSGDLKFGSHTLTVQKSGGDLTHSITLAAGAGRTYFDFAGVPPASGLWIGDGASPAIVDGDQAYVPTQTDEVANITWSNDGSFIIDGTGTHHISNIETWDATDSTWSTPQTMTVNIPPSWAGGEPAIASTLDTSVTVSGEINDEGTMYVVVLPDLATAPSSAQVKAGTNASDVAAPSNSQALVANTQNTVQVTSLSSNTAYDVYVVAEDELSNLQTSPVKLDVTTTASGLNITSIDGDDIITANQATWTITVDDTTGVTGVLLGSISQSHAITNATTLTITGVDYFDATGDLKFGNHLVTVQHPGGNATRIVTLNPESGKVAINVSGLPWPAGAYSVLETTTPAAANGDQFEGDTTTSPGGYPITYNINGTFSIDTDDDISTQTFDVRFYSVSEGAWSTTDTFTINTPTTQVVLDGTLPSNLPSIGRCLKIAPQNGDIIEYETVTFEDSFNVTVLASSHFQIGPVTNTNSQSFRFRVSTDSGTTWSKWSRIIVNQS